MLCQPVHPESNISHFPQCSLWGSALFLLIFAFHLERVALNNFCSVLRVSWRQPTKFDKLIFNRFWSLLCQPMRPQSSIRHPRSFSLFHSPPLFFLKTRLQFRKCKLKIIFTPSLGSLLVREPNLVILCLTDFVAYSANQCTHYQIKDIRAVFLCLTVLLGFSLKLVFELERVTGT